MNTEYGDEQCAHAYFSLEGKTCALCSARPATSWWVGEGGTMDFVHGMAVPCCERCAVERQLTHAREMAAKVPELEAKLAALS